MRRTIDEAATFDDAIVILMHIEEELGITIEDETIEAVQPWSDLTLHDLATAVDRSSVPNVAARGDQAVRAAVRVEFPNAPEPLDFAAPLRNAISPHRNYGGY